MRNWYTIIFLCFLHTTSFGQTDAKVDAVYTLGKIPAPLGVYNHVVQARLLNTGITTLTDLPVTLNVTGANTFTNTQLVTIDAGATLLVSFEPFSPWNTGSNTITVSIPADDDNTNNSAAYTQLVNDHTFSYADASPVASSVGFGTGEGMLSTRYEASGSCVVRQVRAHISNTAANIGNTVYAVVTNFGFIIGQSAPHIITAADLDAYVSFDITDPPAVEAEFFVGLVQLSDGVSEYYPLAYQAEGATTRPNTYFASLPDGSGMTSLDFIGRLMLEAVVDIGTETPFNSSTSSIASYPIAAWNFSGVNSPAQFAATTFDTLLSSSNLLTRGPGAVAGPGVHTFRTAGFQNDGIATANTDYFQATLSPKAGDTLSLSSISGYVNGNSDLIKTSGVNSQFAYSLDGINFTMIGSAFLTTDFVKPFNVSLASIPALQNIVAGTVVTIRYYASGEGASGDWGFVSIKPGVNGLAFNGRLVTANKLLLAPVVPTGADFTLADCNTTASGSISFVSTGNFSPNNQYKIILGDINEPHANIFIFQDTVTVGTLNSNANSGVIDFTIPAGTRQNNTYALKIISTEPYVSGSLSQGFLIKNDFTCKTQPQDIFRSKASGDWTDLNTWESSNGTVWMPATSIPDDLAAEVQVSSGNTVTVTTNVNVTNVIVKGTLKLLNDASNKGMISFNTPPFLQSSTMRIDTSGTFQVVSANEIYHDAILYLDGRIRVFGRILIGDGTVPVSTGFEGFATGDNVLWFSGSAFEWNADTPFATNGITYFPNSLGVPAFRLTKIAAGTLGGNDNTTINALLEVNTPATWAGAGTKTFRDGIKGSSILTQTTGCGKFFTTAAFQDIPASSLTSATKQGILGGRLKINLNGEGLTCKAGITIPDTSSVTIAGSCLSLQAAAIQAAAKLNLDAGSVFNLENADLLNAGILNGPGIVQFTGDDPSSLTSTGMLTASLLLINKQLFLGGNTNTDAISLTSNSNLTLGHFNLNMGAADLIGNETNFIVTNDTGRLSRYVTATAVSFPVGTDSHSYTPVTITNSGNPDNIKAGVSQGVQSTVPVTRGNVDRTWNIGDSSQSGADLTLVMQWNPADEQPDFDRTHCYISHYVSCLSSENCTPFFDTAPAGNCNGTTAFSIQRSMITDFHSPAFVVTSKQFIYTFTGNGNWNNPANWTPAVVAPVIITPGIEVYIDPTASGECVYNGNIKIKQGGKLKVQPGKKLKITGDLTVE